MTNRTRFLLLVTGIASFILLGLAQAIFGPVLPVYSAVFGLPISSVSWLISLFWTGCLAAVIAVYLLPQRLGPKSGLALAALGTAMMALMGSWALVLVGSTIFGAGYGIIAAVYNPRVLAAFGPRGPAMVSLLNAIFTLGAIASPQIFLALKREPGVTFWAFTAVSLTVLAVAALMGDTRGKAAEDAVAKAIDPAILGFAACGIGMEATIVGLGPTALEIGGKSADEAIQLLSLFFLTYLAARLSLVFIAHRVPAFLLYMLSMALACGLALAILLGAEPAIAFPLMGFACGPVFHGAYLTGLSLMGANTRVSALMLGAGLVGAILMPMAIAQVLGGLGPMGLFQILLGLSAILTLLAALMARRLMRA